MGGGLGHRRRVVAVGMLLRRFLRGQNRLQIGVGVTGAGQIVDIGEQLGERRLVVAAEVRKTIIRHHDRPGSLLVDVDDSHIHVIQPDRARRCQGVVTGKDLHRPASVRPAVDHQRPVLPTRAQRLRNTSYITAARILLVRVQLVDVDAAVLDVFDLHRNFSPHPLMSCWAWRPTAIAG